MPMVDLTLPKDALSEQQQAELMETLTDTLLKWEGDTGQQGPELRGADDDRLDVRA
jgi:hypothetical protein